MLRTQSTVVVLKECKILGLFSFCFLFELLFFNFLCFARHLFLLALNIDLYGLIVGWFLLFRLVFLKIWVIHEISISISGFLNEDSHFRTGFLFLRLWLSRFSSVFFLHLLLSFCLASSWARTWSRLWFRVRRFGFRPIFHELVSSDLNILFLELHLLFLGESLPLLDNFVHNIRFSQLGELETIFFVLSSRVFSIDFGEPSFLFCVQSFLFCFGYALWLFAPALGGGLLLSHFIMLIEWNSGYFCLAGKFKLKILCPLFLSNLELLYNYDRIPPNLMI